MIAPGMHCSNREKHMVEKKCARICLYFGTKLAMSLAKVFLYVTVEMLGLSLKCFWEHFAVYLSIYGFKRL